MLTVSFVVTALVIAGVVGGGITAWLWTTHCRQLVAAGGLRALAAMRWREFSRFVIEALQQQGFEASRIEPDANRGQQADLLLNRDGQTWLLSCKQGVNYRIKPAMVDELARAVRGSNARGGILATLGRIDPDARRQDQGIELLDGATLWPLIDPLLPPSLHRDLVARAHTQVARATGLVWVGALALGLTVAMLLTGNEPGMPPDSMPAEQAPAVAAPAAAAETTTVAPAGVDEAPAPSEDQDRLDITRSVSALPGVERAAWATRSTLLVHLLPDASPEQIDAICPVLERSELLRTSRVQLQPPPGSSDTVRFIQCRTF
ncbi:restriction endonuclease [Lysobacter sp. F60174L2]|uniref:restriction endonuclease n=1 Tax=Lysobacter sp. F60174L2 TaxID=3459295 RepID=UPI00403DDC63